MSSVTLNTLPREVWSLILENQITNPEIPKVCKLFNNLHKQNLNEVLQRAQDSSKPFPKILSEYQFDFSNPETRHNHIYELFQVIVDEYLYMTSESTMSPECRMSLSKNRLYEMMQRMKNQCDLAWHEHQRQLKNSPESKERNFNNEGLTAVPPELLNYTHLRKLSFFKNDITELPKEVGKLTNLIFLELSSNKLKSLPSEIGNLSNLEHLGCGSNRLTEIPETVGALVNLTFLNLSFNHLIDLPRSLLHCQNLKEVSLSGKGPTDIQAILRFANLEAMQKHEVRERLHKMHPDEEFVQRKLFGSDQDLLAAIDSVDTQPSCAVS